ncbi:MAG TPA: ECF transporter S component [Clostridia bacterium]|nr:ECF transporter S component [Clostridia bacterium]
MNNKIVKLSLAGNFLALCMVLPMLTGQIPQVGMALGPMHIPVLLCGFICGWPYGLAVGFIAPLLRFALFGMPPIFPMGLSMAFELAVYGLIAGLMYSKLPKKVLNIYITLVTAMIGGRLVWGAASYVFFNLAGKQFSFALFLSGALTTALPGIILHILLIPLIVIAWRAVQPKALGDL